MEEFTTPSTSVLTSLTFVWDSKRGLGKLHAQHGGKSFTNVIAGEGGILFLKDIVCLRVLVDRTGECGAQSGQVSSAIGIRDGIGEAEDLIGVGVVVLKDCVDEDLVALARDDDRFRVENRAGLSKLADKFLDTMLIEEGLRTRAMLLVITLVGEDDLDPGVQECEFAKTSREALKLEGDSDREDLRIRQEGDEGAGLLLVLQLAENSERLSGLALGEGHEVDLSLAHNLDLEPGGECVDALRTDAMETA